MIPPVTYQGAKGRLAAEIVTHMGIPEDAMFYDLCCASGAITLAAVDAGHAPDRVVMVEQGPWGLFWRSIGDGTFDLHTFRHYCQSIPADPRGVKAVVEAMYKVPAGDHAAYRYLLLQAAAIGGKSISLERGLWVRGSGFRDYWLPTATSSRRSPVNPMMPMPNTIYTRVEEIVTKMRGVQGVHSDATDVIIQGSAVIYIDPPYAGTTGYGYTIDAVKVARRIAEQGHVVWVSEGKPLSDEAICLSKGRAKGGITGGRKCAANEEWLSCFRPNR